jgi:hypothetical protein
MDSAVRRREGGGGGGVVVPHWQPAAGSDPERRVGAVSTAGVARGRPGAAAAAGRVHDQLRHVHVHADLLRTAREP